MSKWSVAEALAALDAQEARAAEDASARWAREAEAARLAQEAGAQRRTRAAALAASRVREVLASRPQDRPAGPFAVWSQARSGEWGWMQGDQGEVLIEDTELLVMERAFAYLKVGPGQHWISAEARPAHLTLGAVRPGRCWRCKGSGVVAEWPIAGQPCPLCGGSGIVAY